MKALPNGDLVMSSQVAKPFRVGRSQAVRLPAEYRFEGTEVYIRRDPRTGDVVLSGRPDSWDDFFELTKTVEFPEEFLTERDNRPSQKRKFSPLR
jgi:antitoxin VapB